MKDNYYKKIPALAAYIDRIGAEELHFRRFMVKEYKGTYYNEKALITIRRNKDNIWDLFCTNKEYAPTKSELEQIRGALMSAEFPKSITVRNINSLRKKLGPSAELYELIDRRNGEIRMVQQRIKDGAKKWYPPWSFWEDGEWRRMEAEGPLLFWKPAKMISSRIMVHEGPKAAKFVHQLTTSPEMVKQLAEHPWGEELKKYEHWGMIGGALAPGRSHWGELRAEKPVEVIYVCDNDHPGHSALQEVSRHYAASLKGLRLDKRFPVGWDLADDMPKEFFKGSRYLGPQFREFIVPATRATELVLPADGKGRPSAKLRRDFREEWLHCVTPEVFVHQDWPDEPWNAQEFNNKIAPFSDVANTALLVQRDDATKGNKLEYNPSREPGIYGSDEGRVINTHVPASIKPEKGDIAPFEEFLANLVANDYDREELWRWCATLIAAPEVKMNYGLLLISETQGVGKGTLGEKILVPLVGKKNASFPSEKEIVDSTYNYWLAHKRLAVVHEIYAGHSSKAYNNLKSIITDRYLTVSKKFQANYEIENWCHIYACSNSMRALLLPNDDRRWFVPKITEVKRDAKYWHTFNLWLAEEGGLGKILAYAKDWVKKNKPVMRGDNAPDSALKREIVEEGYSAGQALVSQVLDAIKEILDGDEKTKADWKARGYLNNAGVFILDKSFIQLIKDQIYEGRHNDRIERAATIRRVARAKGWAIGEYRANIKDWGALGAKMICSSKELAGIPPGDLCNERMKPEERLRPLDLNMVVKI